MSPIGNLSFISKLIERAVVVDLNRYIHDSGLGEPLQSAYRPLHGRETVVLRIKRKHADDVQPYTTV